MAQVDRLHTKALVLRVVDFGESDQIVHLLTENFGRLTAVAKGAKRSLRRFPGTLDFFHLLQIQAVPPRSAGLARMESARIVDSFESLRCDPRRFAFGCYFLELLDRLSPENLGQGDAEALFDFALEVLRFSEENRPDIRLVTMLKLRSLAALGLRPVFSHCVRCEGSIDTVRTAFHVGEGGAVCEACLRSGEAPYTVHLGTLRALDRGLVLPIAQLPRLALSSKALEEARELVERFEHFHLGLELHSESLLVEFLEVRRSFLDTV